MAPFQVNGNTQGLFGLAPPLVKHSGGAGAAIVARPEPEPHPVSPEDEKACQQGNLVFANNLQKLDHVFSAYRAMASGVLLEEFLCSLWHAKTLQPEAWTSGHELPRQVWQRGQGLWSLLCHRWQGDVSWPQVTGRPQMIKHQIKLVQHSNNGWPQQRNMSLFAKPAKNNIILFNMSQL